MKEIIIIVVSLLIVIIGSNISQAYLNTTGNELIEKLEELKVEIEKAQNSEENNSKDLANTIYEKWEKVEEKWSIIITHNELDLIQVALIGMKTYIEEDKYEDAMEELEKSSFLLEHIQQKEKLALKNVL